MASTLKVDKLEGSTGSTITVPTGQTLTLTDGLAVSSLPVVTVAKGGTNLSSFTAGDVLYATGSTTLAKLTKGTAEQVLAMNSGATAPDWGSVDLTVLPTVSVAKGGTNLTSFTAGDFLYATGSTTLAKLTASGHGSKTLKMNSGATAPEWVTVAASGGKVLQHKQFDYETQQTLGINNTTADSGLSMSITPTATTSKILMEGHIMTGTDGGYGGFGWILKRDSTVIGVPASGGTSAQYRYHVTFINPVTAGAGGNSTPVAFNWLDSPSTTSATTYKLTAKGVSGTTNMYVNRSTSADFVMKSVLNLWEIDYS